LIPDCPTWRGEGVSRKRGLGACFPQKSLKSWSSEMPFLVFWEQNFCLKCSLNRLWFLCIFLFGWLLIQVFDFIYFCAVFKVFQCISFHYMFSDMFSFISIIRIHFKMSEQISKFFLSWLNNMVKIRDFQANSRESLWNWDVWTVCKLIQYYQKKGRREFILVKHSLEFYNFLVCCLRFLVEPIPKQKLFKGLPVLPM